MKTKAAVLLGPDRDFELRDLDLDEPSTNEVLIRFVAAGLCHSDLHLRHKDASHYPMVGGHEGAGVVEKVGVGVTRLAPGDHVICSFLPVCGRCRWCATGYSNLCDMGAFLLQGCLPDGTYRFHLEGQDVRAMCMLGTFSERAVISESSCVKVAKDVPLDKAVLIGCGVPTGFGSAVYGTSIIPGDTVVIYGIGGIGINAVQGAALAGAANVVAVDPVPFKLEMAKKLGATHTVPDARQAHELVQQLTHGVGADKAIVTIAEVTAEDTAAAVECIRKAGTVVITGLAQADAITIMLPSAHLTNYQKRIQGALFGSGNPFADIPRLVQLYRSGQLEVDELITQTYALDQVNQGYADLLAGRNIRGVILYDK